MFSKYLLLVYLGIVMSVKVSILKRCACSEYGIESCDLYPYCSWNDDVCGPLQCSNKFQSSCAPATTYYRCIWDQPSNKCVDHTYSCSQFGNRELCYRKDLHGQSCSWSPTLKCVEFTCSNSVECNISQCAYLNGQCRDPITQTINCGSVQGTCIAGDGNGKYCFLNDAGICTSQSASPQCHQLSSFKDQCYWPKCYYDELKQRCFDYICQYLSQEYCIFTYDDFNKQITICHWDGTSCNEANEAELQTLNQDDCLYYTQHNYEWQDYKCQACKTLEDNKIPGSDSNLLIGFVLFMLGYM